MNRKRNSNIKSCEVSSIETIRLGNFAQKIAIEGKKSNLPIVIFLHGGPGLPMPFSVGCRGLYPDIIDRFIMVYWDQLGCGINNYKISDDFSIEHFVNMAIDLTKEIRSRFPKNKLYLFGMSFGSILTLHCALRVPNLIDGAVAYGQIVKAPLLSDAAFDAVENSAAPVKQKNIIRNLRSKGTNLSLREMMFFSKTIRKYTDGYNNRNSKTMPIGSLLKGLMLSPDYKFKDFLAVFLNGYIKNESLAREMATIDFCKLFDDITVPYHIFQGETDIVTSTSDVLEMLDGLKNDYVNYTVLPGMGHFPSETGIHAIFDKIQ